MDLPERFEVAVGCNPRLDPDEHPPARPRTTNKPDNLLGFRLGLRRGMRWRGRCKAGGLRSTCRTMIDWTGTATTSVRVAVVHKISSQ